MYQPCIAVSTVQKPRIIAVCHVALCHSCSLQSDPLNTEEQNICLDTHTT